MQNTHISGLSPFKTPKDPFMGFNSDLENPPATPFQPSYHYRMSFVQDHEVLVLQDPGASIGLAGFDDTQTMQNSLNWTIAETTTGADISDVVFASLNDPLELDQHMDWECQHTPNLNYSAVETGSAEEAILALKPTALYCESLRRSLDLECLEAAKVSNSTLAPLIAEAHPWTGIGRAFSDNHGKRAQKTPLSLEPVPSRPASQTRERFRNDSTPPTQRIAEPTKRWSPTRSRCQSTGLTSSPEGRKAPCQSPQVTVKLTIDSRNRARLESTI